MLKRLHVWIARKRRAMISIGINGAYLERGKIIAEYHAELRKIDDEIDEREHDAINALRRLNEMEQPAKVVSAFLGGRK